MSIEKIDGAKPCPFCGGTEIYAERYEHHAGQSRYRVLCGQCMGQIDTGTDQMAGFAIDRWNRRFERTCRPTSFGDNPEAGVFVPQMMGTFCSECGEDLSRDRFTGKYPNYCKNCGAKVEEDR